MPATIKGGDRLNRWLRIAKTAEGAHVAVGFFETGRYPDGTPIAAVAAWNEFGTESSSERPFTIKERPFLRPVLKSRAVRNQLRTIIKTGINPNTMRLDQRTAGRMGTYLTGEIQKKITALSDPSNAPSTVARKGSSNPLIDNGDMRRAVTFEVGAGGGTSPSIR